MELDDYNTYCQSLPATTHVVQWGDSHVWKVGGKVFAIAGWSDGDAFAVTFKTSREEFGFLVEMPGVTTGASPRVPRLHVGAALRRTGTR
ncbi:MAG: MmcQ/YjbR family DNA-binding protein [Acidimicrobiales bacterium]